MIWELGSPDISALHPIVLYARDIQGVPKKRTFRIAGDSAAFRAAGQSLVTRPGIDPRLLIDGNSESAFFGTPCI